MGKDFHKAPFDEGTKVKLALYDNYIREWLPVFVQKAEPLYDVINIFDFFAGPGLDVNGEKGSPLITIEALAPYLELIPQKNLTVNLYFNEFIKRKLQNLKLVISKLELDDRSSNIFYSDHEFQEAFDKYYDLMTKDKSANFLFLDQSGIKQITDDVFKAIINLPTTDFLFFVSSSTIKRFCDHPEIKKHIHISRSAVTSRDYWHIHRVVFDYYRTLIPRQMEYYLSHFTIKKGSNIYGLIFGSRNLLGIYKFVNTCWKIDPVRGEANFDIDQNGIVPGQPALFDYMNRPTKLKKFEERLASQIVERSLQTNKEIFCFALTEGVLPKHARAVVNDLIKRNILPAQKVYISYDSCKPSQQARQIEYS